MMPQVRKHHASVVHGRDQRAHVASSRRQERGDRETRTRPRSRRSPCRAAADGTPSRVLQQRIQVAAVLGGGNMRSNGFDVKQQEQQEADGQSP
jgi:hypothetical protein